MIRLATFFVVLAIIAVLFLKSWKTAQPSGQSPASAPKLKARPKRPVAPEEFWMQVYDTDSMEDAKKIQRKFFDSEIPCLVYQQGKKDVYGDRLKHYGVSVPREAVEKAQNLLTRIAF